MLPWLRSSACRAASCLKGTLIEATVAASLKGSLRSQQLEARAYALQYALGGR